MANTRDKWVMEYFLEKRYEVTLKNARGGLATEVVHAANDDQAFEKITRIAEQAKSTIHTWKQI